MRSDRTAPGADEPGPQWAGRDNRRPTVAAADGDADLFDFLADLEARAGALHHRERAEQVRDRARSAYAEVTLESRLMASVGHWVSCDVRGVGRLAGTLTRVGAGWCQLAAPERTWCVDVGAVRTVRGTSGRAVPHEAWRAVDRLALPSVLRRLAEEARRCVVHLDDGSRREGAVVRVAADFVEMVLAGGTDIGIATGTGTVHARTGPRDEVTELLAVRAVSAVSWDG